MSLEFLSGSQLAAQGIFVSAIVVSTGAAQSVAHGLNYTPTHLLAIPVIGSNGGGAAGVQLPAAPITITAGATNLTVTGPAAFNGGSWQAIAW